MHQSSATNLQPISLKFLASPQANIVLKLIQLPRDAMHKRGLCRRAVSVSPSDWVSVTTVSKRAYIPSNFFHNTANHIILDFRHQTLCSIPTGTPLTGASNAGGVWIVTIFDQYLSLSRWCYYRMRIGSRTKAFERYHFQCHRVISNPFSWSRYYSTSTNSNKRSK